MKSKKVFLTLFLTTTLLISGACGGKGNASTSDTESGSNTEQTVLELTKKYDGESVDILNSNLRSYFNLKDEQKICAFLKSRQNQNYEKGQAVSLKWTKTKTPYTVKLSENSDLSNVVLSKSVYVENLSLSDTVLTPGRTYYYSVTDGNGVSTETDSFTVLNGVKWYAIGGVRNARDIGGWQTVDGNTVNFGKIIRTANLDAVDEGGKNAIGMLGAVSDLDLRTDTEAANAEASPVNGLNYTRISITMYDRILHTNERENIRKTISFLANERNYPVILHCKAGADRTGTIAFLINGLCGVPYEDLTHDFELTSFSGAGTRWRSNIVQKDGVSVFDESGVMSYDSGLYVAWNKMYYDILETYPSASGLLSESIKSYMLDIGVTEDEISNILKIMLD